MIHEAIENLRQEVETTFKGEIRRVNETMEEKITKV